MDILTPDTYWIDDRCYRRNPSKTRCVAAQQKFWSSSENNSAGKNDKFPSLSSSSRPPPGLQKQGDTGGNGQNKPYVEEDEYGWGSDELGDNDNEYLIENKGDYFKSICDNVPSQLYAVVIGTKGSTKSRLEKETKTKIIVPRQNAKGFIEVEGRSILTVRHARRRIDELMWQTRIKCDATHFACFPVNSAAVIQRIKDFKEEVTSRIAGADPFLFLEAEKCHITICVTTLFDEKEREKAAQVLEQAQKEISKQLGHTGKITVHLKELEIMNDDPTQVDIVYAKCHDKGDVLQQMADYIAKKFDKSGLSRQARGDHVKLHCTMMNSLKKAERLIPDKTDQSFPSESVKFCKKISRKTFDASQILKEFKDYDFGVVDITEIKLATRFTSGPDGFYKCFRTIPL
ncbi:activating signal cointegrator 1 complex subunit 1 isoform X2 [Folsomia candida]|uniref:activating signal cointegrator 1 complex subunit 1 isoform X2 n=1 Tax=Folsomia candida TaxID=158441 RepID=UPI0016054937|nr:activating signal cointegrator 1 complex subunit 1 isoform X2 [Folsomia candida]